MTDRIQGLGDKFHWGLDEIVAEGCNVHIERLASMNFYLSIQFKDGRELVCWLGSNRTISVNHEWRASRNSGTVQS